MSPNKTTRRIVLWLHKSFGEARRSTPVQVVHLDEMLTTPRAVLDMSRMICRDSTAVDLLVEHSRRMNLSGGALLIRCPPGVG